MKDKLLSPKGLDARGVGPRIMLFTIPLIIAGIWASINSYNWSYFPWPQPEYILWIGYILAFGGLVFFIIALVQFSKGFPTGKLITTGAFSISRNPVYVSWMVLLLPGLSLALNNWLFLAAALVMYTAFMMFIKEEEQTIRSVYGEEYNNYTAKTDRIGIIPRFRFTIVSHNTLRISLGALLALIALNAFGGGYYGMIGAEGVPLELLAGSVFSSYFIPSIILFVAVGGMATVASLAVFTRSGNARQLSFITVLIIFKWITAQIAIIGCISWLQPATAMAGVVILILTLLWREPVPKNG